MTAATWLGIAAVLIALVSAYISNRARVEAARSADAAHRSAVVDEAADHRERQPVLDITLTSSAPFPADLAIYRVRNDGVQDLDSVIVHRPRPPNQIVYQVAVTGGSGDLQDEIDLGPIVITQGASFTLGCGANEELPEFRVRIEVRAGTEVWTLNELLPNPRGEPEPWIA